MTSTTPARSLGTEAIPATDLSILIVEDLPSDAELCQHVVSKVLPSCRYLRVETREEFTTALDTFRPDLILSDFMLPSFDGLSALKIALEQAPEVPFIIVTGSINEDTAVECMKVGAWDYIIKQNIARLPYAVKEALAHRQAQRAMAAAEDAMRAKETLHRTLIDNLPQLVWHKDRSASFVTCNLAFAQAVGVPPEEITGKGDHDFYPTELAEKYRADDRRAMETGEILDLEEDWIQGGRERVLRTAKVPLRNEKGEVYGTLGIAEDITERKRLEETIRRSRDQLLEQQKALAAVIKSDVFTGDDLDESIRRLLEVAARQQQVARVSFWRFEDGHSSIRCVDLYELAADRHSSGLVLRAADYPSYFTALESEETIVADDTRCHPATREFWESYFKPRLITSLLDVPVQAHGQLEGVLCHAHTGEPIVWSPEQRLFALSIANLVSLAIEQAESRRLQKERDSLQEQLLQSQKMEAVGRLAGGVAHDFNNMLQVILGYCFLSQKELPADHPLIGNLDQVQSAAQRAADITRQLLAFARKQTVNPRRLDLNMVVSGMLKMLRRLIGEDIDLLWIAGDNLWDIFLDPSQIDQILVNLTVNARDAISGTGKVTVETSNVVVDNAYCASHLESAPGQYVRLTFSDSGCGMDKKTLDQIFEPFFTTKGPGEGTGLGLPTIYGIVKQNNGFVNVYSEVGKGTTFSIYFPRHEAEAEAPPEKLAQDGPVGGTETVLVVEDENAILNLAKRILENLGYRVLVAGRPTEALRLAQRHQGDIHLLVTDVVMPEMNGRRLHEQIHSIRPNIKCLYMSGYPVNAIVHRGVLDKGLVFLQKPFSSDGMAARVREALDR
ncbi:MAG: Sensor histidine kinase RcsC [bacterium]|nr:Sensor histidine kinase RcsC [bacterium]